MKKKTIPRTKTDFCIFLLFQGSNQRKASNTENHKITNSKQQSKKKLFELLLFFS